MLKRIMAIAAVSGLALTSALAQTNAPSTSTTPSATNPAPLSDTATPAKTAAANPAGKANFVTKQSPDQHLASKFNGTDVIGANDEKIGDVSDLLFDKDHKIVAFIVGVGGFLGIGAKDVAIDPASFQAVAGKDATDTKLRLSMTKEELKAAPTFERYQPPRPVSSQNAPTRPMGAPPMTPAPKSSTQ
jgi:sporulation protein YlmC with PRC-barrel domain